MTKEQRMTIYKEAENVWSITTKDDRILLVLHDETLEIYRLAEDVTDLS